MTVLAPSRASSAFTETQRLLAIGAILGAMAIWGLQFVMIRLAVTSSLTWLDVALLRYLFGLPAMLPVLLAHGFRDAGGMGWRRATILSVLGGAPMLMMSNFALQFAPAAHASCLQPGAVTVVSTLFVLAASGRREAGAMVGLCLTVGGLAGVALGGGAGADAGPWTLIGDALFILSGVCWASYTILLVRWQASPLVSTAAACLLSLLFVLLLLPFSATRLAAAPWSDILLHGLFQGVVNFSLAFALWAYAARILGPVELGVFAPLIPIGGVFSAIAILGEIPAPLQWLGVSGVALGLLAIAVAQRRARKPEIALALSDAPH